MQPRMFREQKSDATASTIDRIDGLHCPITRGVFKNPVVDEHGHTFEEEVIKEWVKKKPTCPLTNQPIDSSKLVPNYALKDSLQVIPIIEKQEEQLRANKKLIEKMSKALDENQRLLREAQTQLDYHLNEASVLEDKEVKKAPSDKRRGLGCFRLAC